MSVAAKNRKITPLFRQARSNNAKINPNYGMRGKHHSDETKKKISLKSVGHHRGLGRKMSLETRQKLSQIKKGRFTGMDSPVWKGDNVGYGSLHTWIRRQLGKARF